MADTLRWVDEMLMRAKKRGRWEVLYDLRIEFVFEAGDEATGPDCEAKGQDTTATPRGEPP